LHTAFTKSSANLFSVSQFLSFSVSQFLSEFSRNIIVILVFTLLGFKTRVYPTFCAMQTLIHYILCFI